MSRNNSKKSNQNGNLLLLGIPALLALCCGLPFLLIAIGLTSIGTFLIGKEVWEFGVVLLIIGLIMFVKHMMSKKTNGGDCCQPKIDKDLKREDK